MRELFRSAWIGLWRRRLRTCLTLCGIAVGACTVMLISGVGVLGQEAIASELESMGVNGLSVSSTAGLTMPCLASIRALPTIKRAMPLLITYAPAEISGGDYSSVVCGIDAGADQVISLELLHGRMLTPGDISAGAAVCVVDEELALASYHRTNVVGKYVTVRMETGNFRLKIVGVTTAGSGLLQTVSAMIPYMMYVPYSTLQNETGITTFDQIAVRMNQGADAASVQKAIERAVVHTGDNVGTVLTEDLAAQRERLESIVSIVTVGLSGIGFVSLLVSGFGIITAMLSSVHERTAEIGLKKAIGATDRHIMSEFLVGSLLMSGLGAAIGIGIGLLLVETACLILGHSFILPTIPLVRVLLLSLLLGAVFGAYPARKAARLRPADALRGGE